MLMMVYFFFKICDNIRREDLNIIDVDMSYYMNNNAPGRRPGFFDPLMKRLCGCKYYNDFEPVALAESTTQYQNIQNRENTELLIANNS
jgi:hypothetical protein